jgi:uncharacterized RDD family membrane protein YckC
VRYLAYQPASILKRVLAMLIDIMPIYLGLLLIFSGVLHIKLVATPYDPPMVQQRAATAVFTINFLTMVLWGLYGILAESSAWRGTFGKKFMKIRVSAQSRNRLTYKAIIIRNVSKLVSWFPFSLGFLVAIFTHGNRTWHDMLSKTCVTDRH